MFLEVWVGSSGMGKEFQRGRVVSTCMMTRPVKSIACVQDLISAAERNIIGTHAKACDICCNSSSVVVGSRVSGRLIDRASVLTGSFGTEFFRNLLAVCERLMTS